VLKRNPNWQTITRKLMISSLIFRQRNQPKAWASCNYLWEQRHCNHKIPNCECNNVLYVSINRKYWFPNCFQREFKSFSFRYCCMAGWSTNLVTGGTGDKHTVTRGVDKFLARPDWKNNSKVAIFRPTRRSLLLWRPGWTDIWIFLCGLQKSEIGRCSLFPSWSG